MDWKIETIVAGSTGPTRASSAARLAATVARQFGARLILAIVVRPPEGWRASAESRGARRRSQAWSRPERRSSTAEAASTSRGSPRRSRRPGSRRHSFADLCRREDADLLVVGRRVPAWWSVSSSVPWPTGSPTSLPCPALTVP